MPTKEPAKQPTASKTPSTTKQPTAAPTSAPTSTKKPTASPTPAPTKQPTAEPTPAPTIQPSGHWEEVWVVDKEAYDEPIYEEVTKVICNGCGRDITNNRTDHIQSAVLQDENTKCCGWHVVVESVQTGVIHHEEEGHWEEIWVED